MMEQTRNVQTAFRFREDMLLKIKNKARRMNMSVNAYVEAVLEDDLKGKENAYGEMKEFGAELYMQLRDIEPAARAGLKLSHEDVDGDERTRYILEK